MLSRDIVQQVLLAEVGSRLERRVSLSVPGSANVQSGRHCRMG